MRPVDTDVVAALIARLDFDHRVAFMSQIAWRTDCAAREMKVAQGRFSEIEGCSAFDDASRELQRIIYDGARPEVTQLRDLRWRSVRAIRRSTGDSRWVGLLDVDLVADLVAGMAARDHEAFCGQVDERIAELVGVLRGANVRPMPAAGVVVYARARRELNWLLSLRDACLFALGARRDEVVF